MISLLFTILTAAAVFSALCTGTPGLTAAALKGANDGISVTLAMAGAICLWSGVSKVMQATGISRAIARFLRPFLGKLFPNAAKDADTLGAIGGNFTANLLGLGNAATPLGISAVRRMQAASGGNAATDEMCRLIVLNTASIQLIPSTVAAVRASLGAAAPFDILPQVWLTSLCSAGAGLTAAWLLGRAYA